MSLMRRGDWETVRFFCLCYLWRLFFEMLLFSHDYWALYVRGAGGLLLQDVLLWNVNPALMNQLLIVLL